jgi:hypothetical protein|tara:strand:- start:209 stop:586 length:378 start_codon:yes stop_codon:yes gene_type:complete
MPVLKEFVKIKKGGRFLSLHIKYASRLSTELALDMEVKDGDTIHFFRDEVKPDNWYLAKNQNDKHGAVIRKRKGRYGYVFFYSAFAKEINEIYRQNKDLIKIKVGPKTMIDKKPYWPLITAQLFK